MTVEEHDVTDTEGNNFKNARGGCRQMNADLEAHAASDVSPFAAPLSLNEGDVIVLHIYPHGLTLEPYRCAEFLVVEFTHTFPLRAPQGFRLRGRSKGEYTKPLPG